MNFLLDTHVFLWLLFEPKSLSKEAQSIIQDSSHCLSVSSVSFWEISLKYSLGKLVLKNFVPEQLAEMLKPLHLESLPLSPEEASSFHRLPKMPHKDPFDRMIMWQAIQNDLTLITKDKHLASYQTLGLKVLW